MCDLVVIVHEYSHLVVFTQPAKDLSSQLPSARSSRALCPRSPVLDVFNAWAAVRLVSDATIQQKNLLFRLSTAIIPVTNKL